MYKNRIHAGEMLVPYFSDFIKEKPLLFGVPRGGIVVAAPVAKTLHVPIDILTTRKIGLPHNPEVAMGAVMPDGSAIWDENIISRLRISKSDLASRIDAEYAEVKRRLYTYTNRSEPPCVKGKPAIIIDDGIATGYTIHAAIRWLRAQEPSFLVVAVPVAPLDIAEALRHEVDKLICPLQPTNFLAVGHYYQDFSQITEANVVAILQDFRSEHLS